jgi:hypothetical protein
MIKMDTSIQYYFHPPSHRASTCNGSITSRDLFYSRLLISSLYTAMLVSFETKSTATFPPLNTMPKSHPS